MAKKKRRFEEALARLEEIVEDMENNATGLETSVALYKEGIELSVFLNESLNVYEKEITQLYQSAEGLLIDKPFDAPGGDED